MNKGARGEEAKLRKQSSCLALIEHTGARKAKGLFLFFLLFNRVKTWLGFDTFYSYSASAKTALVRVRKSGESPRASQGPLSAITQKNKDSMGAS